jgi:hypothetical protein
MVLAHSSLTWARAAAGASASGHADTFTYATTSMDELCEYWYTHYDCYSYWYVFYCTDETAEASAYGHAFATAYGSGLGSALASNAMVVGGNVNVCGKDLQEFTTAVGGYAGSFAIADAEAFAKAYANAFAYVYTLAYEEVCKKVVERDCYKWCSRYYPWWDGCVDHLCNPKKWCKTSWDYDSGFASAFTEAYASAVAHAAAGAKVQFAAQAHFERTQGLTSDRDDFGGDTIEFLGEAGAKVYAIAQCEAIAIVNADANAY